MTLLKARIFFLLMLLSGTSFSQDKSFEIHFKNGDFLPEKNIEYLLKDKSSLTKAVSGTNYFVVIQFNDIPNELTKKFLFSRGVRLRDYLPDFAYTAIVPVSLDFNDLLKCNARSVFALKEEFKVSEKFQEKTFPEWSVKSPGTVDLTVIAWDTVSDLLSGDFLNSIHAKLLHAEPLFNSLTIRIPVSSYDQLLRSPLVQWVEPISPDRVAENLPGKNLHRSNVLSDGPSNLTGNGVRIGIWDGGQVGPHNDLAGRLTLVETASPSDNHATHVSGTMAGAGLIDPFARGMASQASVYSYDFNGYIDWEVATAISTYSIVMTQNSWGYGDAFVDCAVKDPYMSDSRAQDINVQNNPFLMHVHSAGNSQSICSGGWGTTTGKAAKNILVVGSVDAAEAISSFSSFGPVQDGRLKPEISGLGGSVYSSTTQNTYSTFSGTSMSTPGVSGTIAQLYQRYNQLNTNANPLSSLIKALVCNNAKDLGNAGPDYKFGYGRINGLQALRALEGNRFAINSVSNTGTNNVTVFVPSGAGRLKVMLCWIDPPAAANANPALVNNLNLTVTNPSSVTFNPWILNPASPGNTATRGVDTRNNIEQVTIDNPAAGNYTLSVNGAAVSSGSQQYALTWTIDQPFIEVTFPNGGEKLRPGTAYTIGWDEYGITSNLTVQYSINNGSTWTTISSSVAAGVNRLSWTVPSTFTSSALIRVTNGTLTDQSDAAFSILGVTTVTAATECATPGSVRLTWTAVSNATHYDLMQLDTVNGIWNTAVSNSTSTSGVISGLVSGRRYWFTVVAKNNANSIVGERAIAKSALASAGAAPAQPGAISGSSSVCEFQGTYSIAAVALADSYTWTVPSGSTIISGQGTSSILVTFGSASGNISVTASNTCGTSPSRTLAVTVGLPPTASEASFISSGAVTINDNNSATPYPSQINVSGLSGVATSVRVRLNSLSHTWVGDVDILLESPAGQRLMLISDCGNAYSSSILNLTFDKKATAFLSQTSALTSGTFLPTNYGSPDDFISLGSIASNTGTSSTNPVTFEGSNPNGIWRLYVMDDEANDVGSIASWELFISTNSFNVTGNTTVCQNQNGVVYSCPAIIGATSYSWSVPPGATIVSGANTTSITVNFGSSSVSGNVSVSASNSCGAISSQNLTVTVNPSLTASVSITSDQGSSICSGTSTTFTAVPVNGGGSPVFQWQLNSVDAGSGGTTFTTSSLANNDVVRCIMTSNESCVSGSPATSNAITISYDPTCTFTFNVSLFIQGFYTSFNQMNAVADPVAFPGLSDSVTLKLAIASSPYTVTHTINGLLSTNGAVQFSIPDSLIGASRYLILRHRNSLETWSASPVLLSAASSYSFVDAASRAYGNNLCDLGGGKFGLWSGDVNQDGQINTIDLDFIQSACTLFNSGYRPEDITGDRIVDSPDYSLIENNLGKSALKP